MPGLLTFHMRKGAEDAARAVASLLHIVAFCGLVDFRMKLLLGPCVTILAIVTGLTVTRFAPLLAVLDIGTWCGPTKAIINVNIYV